MKIYYFNDRNSEAFVRVINTTTDYKLLEPAEGAIFEVDVPEGSIPFIKVWETNVVLISYSESVK